MFVIEYNTSSNYTNDLQLWSQGVQRKSLESENMTGLTQTPLDTYTMC